MPGAGAHLGPPPAARTMTSLGHIAAVARLPGFARLALLTVMLGLGQSLAQPYVSLFVATAAGFSARQIGIYMMVSALAGVVATTWLGRLSDQRLARGWTLLIALAGGALGYALMSQLRGFPALLLNTASVLAVGRAAFPQTFALSRARFEAARASDLTLATNTLRMFFSVAWVVGPALGALLLARLRWNGLFLAAAGAYALAMLLLWRTDTTIPAGAAPRARTNVLRHLRNPGVAAPTAGFALMFLCSSLNMVVFPLYVVETLHGAERHVGWLLGLAAALEIPFMLGSAFLATALGPRGKPRLLAASTVLYAAYFTWFAMARAPWQLYPAQVLNAAVISVVMGLGLSAFQEQLPGEAGLSTALYANAMTLGAILAGVVFGAMAGGGDHRRLLFVCAGLSLAAGALFLVGHGRWAAEDGGRASG
jgi:SET family sugar efflux transporter-like MFS transporter